MCPDLCPEGNGERRYFKILNVINGVPTGIRTPVAGVKGQCPRPLDDGDICKHSMKRMMQPLNIPRKAGLI